MRSSSPRASARTPRSIRQQVCQGLTWLGVRIDPDANQRGNGCISPEGCTPSVWVIPTDEEAVIASHTLAVVRSSGHRRLLACPLTGPSLARQSPPRARAAWGRRGIRNDGAKTPTQLIKETRVIWLSVRWTAWTRLTRVVRRNIHDLASAPSGFPQFHEFDLDPALARHDRCCRDEYRRSTGSRRRSAGSRASVRMSRGRCWQSGEAESP